MLGPVCFGPDLTKMSDFEVRHAVRVGGGRSRFDL
jgi:hypothetical protein